MWVHWLCFPSKAALPFWEARAEGSMTGWSRAVKGTDKEGLLTWVRDEKHKALYAL